MSTQGHKRQGVFITFEGGEGAGKTTQIKDLAATLRQKNHDVLTTREPGGTPEAEKIRNLLVQRDGGEWTPMAECLLLYAARIMHTDKVIRPALQNNIIVLCDRYADSTLAYQGYGSGIPLEDIHRLERLCLGSFEPDTTFILDIDPALGLERSGKRLAQSSSKPEQTEDRFELRDLSFHQKLRDGFLSIAAKNRKRCVIIDAAQSADMIATTIQETLKQRYGF